MAIIDILTVQLTLDAQKLRKEAQDAEETLKETRDAAEKTGSSMADIGKKGADAFAAIRQEAHGALALFTGGKSLAGFTQDIAAASTALGSLSRQLDIAPQKLIQLQEAMKASGGPANDVDAAFKSIQSKANSGKDAATLTRLSRLTGVDFLDRHGKVRADMFDQMAHSSTWHHLSRGQQENYASQLGFSSAVVNLVNRPDYDALQKQFSGLGPSAAQIRQGEQLLADWTELKANTDQIMRRAFSEMEPTLHNFLQALIALEKAHPEEIAKGVAGIATALSLLSALLTAKPFLQVLGLLSSLGTVTGVAGRLAAGAGIGITTGIAAAVAHDVRITGHSPWGDTGAAEYYAQQEGGQEKTDTEQQWKRIHSVLHWLGNAFLPSAHADDTLGQPPHEIHHAHVEQSDMAASASNSAQKLLDRYHTISAALAARDGQFWTDNGLWPSHLLHETSDRIAGLSRNHQSGNIVHHNTTTHSPTINVVVNGGMGSPNDICRMTQKGISDALMRHETGRIG